MSESTLTKIEIEINDIQKHFLKKFAEKHYLGSEENSATICPIHVVQTRKERAIDPKYQDPDTITFFNKDMGLGFSSLEKMIKYYYKDKDLNVSIIPYNEAINTSIVGYDTKFYSIYNEDSYLKAYGIDPFTVSKVYIEYYYENVAYFFIKDEANEYIEYQKHNLIAPRVYTFSPGYANCSEYIPFWNLLLNIGQKLNKENINDNNESAINKEQVS